jgi:hypothetical protein
MIWLISTIATSFLSIFTFIIPVVVIGTIVGLISVYFLTVIYSLYKIFLIESKQKDVETTVEA